MSGISSKEKEGSSKVKKIGSKDGKGKEVKPHM
jgi:hypothetical protein